MNITNMALIGVAAGYATAVALTRWCADGASTDRWALWVSSASSALVGTVSASMGFVVEYAIGGAAQTSLGTVAAYMLGTHVLIGIGEG